MTAASVLGPLFHATLGKDLPVRVEFWDGSAAGPATDVVIRVRSPLALRRILYAPHELGFARAYVAGDLDIEGDPILALEVLRRAAPHGARLGWRSWVDAARAAQRLGVLGTPPAPPPEEARLRGRRHTRERDRAAISHHYDVSNDFYRLLLGPTMTYSCARFVSTTDDLETAQAAKHDLVCRKLGLQDGMRLLDVGCGWGGMVVYAAAHYGVEAVGITLSQPQADLARKRAAEAGLANQVEIRLQDYRDLPDEPFDAVSSIGMFEHVGRQRMTEYFAVLSGLLRPRGRLLNHAISKAQASQYNPNSFLSRYVFPDGELLDVATVAEVMERCGLEVRDVESLREHYALTLRRWLDNLDESWDEAVRVVGRARASVWRLYMAGSVLSFEEGSIGVHQVLGVKPDGAGSSGLALTRAGMV